MQASSPLLIASPVRRSGTTLLLRLFCSADNALIYGDSIATDVNVLLNLSLTKGLMYASSRDRWDAHFESVLGGAVNDWIADLMPPMSGYLETFQNMPLNFLQYLQSQGIQRGRPIWGIKMAEWPPPMLLALQRILPQARLVYIVRDLADSVRSAKAAGMLVNPQEVHQFCHTHQQNCQYIRQQFAADRLLWLEYEQLVAAPEASIQRLEAFSGARGIDLGVFQHRVNT
ncbi:MAG: sulfotransferase, partial [Bacteroidota bacterium]